MEWIWYLHMYLFALTNKVLKVCVCVCGGEDWNTRVGARLINIYP